MKLSNIDNIYNSRKTTIISAINLINTNPSVDGKLQWNTCCKRSVLPFLGDALRWFTGTATTTDVNSIKTRVNQLITTQSSQQDTLVHIISIINVTWYAVQVNRHSINILMNKVDEASHDINNLYNLTTSLATSISFHQLILHIRSVFANFHDSLSYIRMVSTHTMDYIDVATSGTLSPHILPVMDLQKMLMHIKETLPAMLHLPVSSDDTLHIYRYLHAHVLIANKQFLLLIDVPIQDKSQQVTIYKIFTLDIPHGNFTACYDITTKYLGTTKDESMAVELPPHPFQICQAADGQFCTIPTLFQPLANPLTCISVLYARNSASITPRCSLQIKKTSDTSIPSQIAPNVWILTTALSIPASAITLICPGKAITFIKVEKPIHILQIPTACSTTSSSFHLPPRYQNSHLEVNISLDMANLNMVNISSLDFCIWQYLEDHRNKTQLQHLATIPSIPVNRIYQHMISGTQHIIPLDTADESTGDTDSIWTLFSHTGIYVTAIGSLIPAGLGVFCCYFFWYQPARLVC